MNLFFATHNKAFKAEWIKLKRTGTLWICFVVALFIPLVASLVEMFVNESSATNAKANWDTFIGSSFSGFAGFFFPLFLVIIVVRLVYMEHKSDTWKLMQTQPVSSYSLFMVKFETALLISFLSLLSLFAFALAGALFLKIGLPKSGYADVAINWPLHAQAIVRLWLSSWSLMAITYFISLVMKSFAWPLIIGLVGIIVGGSFAGFEVLNWFPFSALGYTISSYKGTDTGNFLLPHETLSIAWTLLFLLLAYRYFLKRGFVRAYFNPASALVLTLSAVLVFAVFFWWINKPVVIPKYGKTIIAGTIKLEKPVDQIIVVDRSIDDTLMIGKIVADKFHLTTSQKLEPGMYYAKAGNVSFPFYFSSGDSLHLNISNTYRNAEIKFSGTRMAENAFLTKANGDFYFLRNYAYNFTPEQYAGQIMGEWKTGVKQIENFKTVSNIRPSQEFIKTQKKLLAVRLLQLLHIDYPKTFAVYHPNEILKYPSSVDRLSKEVNMSDSSLVRYADYVNYLSDYYAMKSSRSLNRDSAMLRYIADSVKTNSVRDELLFAMLSEKLDYIRDSSRRTMTFAALLPNIHSDSYKERLIKKLDRLNSLMKGKLAPDFKADALVGDQVSLANFSKRFVVIDVWATWCGPCKRENPYFTEYAEQFTSPGVAFVSISVDENKQEWEREAGNKSKRVAQLWAVDGGKEFSKAYAVNTIPRFMLIDPKGRIVNAQLPPPSDPEFESVLRREIPSEYFHW